MNKTRISAARVILKKKKALRAELELNLPKDKADAVWSDAEKRLSAMLERWSSLPNGVRSHTDKKIFPSAAIYLAAREELDQSDAYRLIEDHAFGRADKARKALAALLRLPGFKGLFMKIWDPMTKKMFGQNSGFENVFYPEKKDEYRMDVVSCPYFRYFTELGCPELTRIYCGCDDRLYGDLPGIEFVRTSTLGRGGERCDFCIRRVRK